MCLPNFTKDPISRSTLQMKIYVPRKLPSLKRTASLPLKIRLKHHLGSRIVSLCHHLFHHFLPNRFRLWSIHSNEVIQCRGGQCRELVSWDDLFFILKKAFKRGYVSFQEGIFHGFLRQMTLICLYSSWCLTGKPPFCTTIWENHLKQIPRAKKRLFFFEGGGGRWKST